jgi:NitT/TauT family transport system substrate-binding protein
MSQHRQATRRILIKAGAASAALGLLGAPAIVRAQAGPKIRIGYWPIAAGLPFYSAIELGYFKEAGLDVEPLKFAGAQQVMEAVLSGRADGTANGTGSANIAIGEIAAPGTFKIFCSNPSNVKNVLDEVIVPVASPAKVMADLKGKRVGSGPGIQNVTWPRPCWSAAAPPAPRWWSCPSASTWPRWPPARSTPPTRWSPPAPLAA